MTTDDDADLAVLEVALAEELGGEGPGDVWRNLGAAHDRDTLRPTTQPRFRWLAAALVVIGTAVVGGVLALKSGRTQPAPQPIHQPELANHRGGPRTLAEAIARLSADSPAMVRSHACRTPTGRWRAMYPIETLFDRPESVELDGDLTAAVVGALRLATAGPAQPATVWEHGITLGRGAETLVLLIGTDAADRPVLAFGGDEGPIWCRATLPRNELRRFLDESTRREVAIRGIVLGNDGFAEVEESTWRLQLYDVDAASLGTVTHFPKLRSLDLAGSPRCHGREALLQIANLPLRSLVLCADAMTADAYTVLGSLTELEELFLVGPEGVWALATVRPSLAQGTLPTLDDRAVAQIARLHNLTELTLLRGSFTDRGLAELATLGKLRRLALLACGGTTPAGWNAFRGHPLALLDLRGCPNPGATAPRLATLPALRSLRLGSPDEPMSLAAVAGLPALTELMIDGRFPAPDLQLVATMDRLEKLTLRTLPPLVDSDLGRLHGARQLRKLAIADSEFSAAAIAALKAALPNCRITSEIW